jgi:hypothetical protein
MRSRQGRFLTIVLAGYLSGLTVQQGMAMGATAELVGPVVLTVFATLVALYAASGS